MKFRLLDTFCKAGGAGMGYHRAGFEVVGVDIEPQKRYPFEFHKGDALEFIREHGHEFDVIHASPPCQCFSSMRKGRWKDREHPDLVEPTRRLLKEIGNLYVIENVVGSPLIKRILLCGTMFGLQTTCGSQLRRHRYFECSIPLWNGLECKHNNGSAIGVYGGGQHPERRKPATIGVWDHTGGASNRDGLLQFSTEDRKDAMGIDWMTGDELSQAIPPAYTEWIGRQLMAYLKRKEVVDAI